MHNAEPMKPLEIGKPCASKGASTVWGEADGKGLSCETTCGDIRQAGLRNYQYLASRLLYFGVQTLRSCEHVETGSVVGIDMGLKVFYTDSDGQTIENPRHYRKAEKKLKRLHRQVSRKHKKSKNRKKARQRLSSASRDACNGSVKISPARRRTRSSRLTRLFAYEQLQIRNLVKNRKLAKSIHDAAWGHFLSWVKAYGIMHDVPIIAVAPQYTSQDCSGCGERVKKTLSTRTHLCPSCGLVLDRDENAAISIISIIRGKKNRPSGRTHFVEREMDIMTKGKVEPRFRSVPAKRQRTETAWHVLQ